MLEPKRTKWVSLNGAGVLPEYQGVGGNALLYVEMEKTLRNYNYEHADLTQVAETAVQMRHDLENVGGKAYKNHRVYQRSI
jgi:galactokinase/mevalonate kinase-like predicted kinase